MVAKVGDALPDVQLWVDNDEDHVSLRDIFKGKKGVIFGLPGAYTPVCSSTHLPEFVEEFDRLKAAGADVVACTSTDNGFCLTSWGKQNGADGKVMFLADPCGNLAKALGLETHVHHLGLISKRYSAVIVDNEIKTLNVEEGAGTGLVCSRAPDTVKQLKAITA